MRASSFRVEWGTSVCVGNGHLVSIYIPYIYIYIYIPVSGASRHRASGHVAFGKKLFGDFMKHGSQCPPIICPEWKTYEKCSGPAPETPVRGTRKKRKPMERFSASVGKVTTMANKFAAFPRTCIGCFLLLFHWRCFCPTGSKLL